MKKQEVEKKTHSIRRWNKLSFAQDYSNYDQTHVVLHKIEIETESKKVKDAIFKCLQDFYPWVNEKI